MRLCEASNSHHYYEEENLLSEILYSLKERRGGEGGVRLGDG